MSDMPYPIVLLGTGPLARSLYTWLRDCELRIVAFFTDDAEYSFESIFKTPVVRSLVPFKGCYFVLGVEDCDSRVRLAAKATDGGLRILDAILHPLSHASETVLFSPGVIVGPFVSLGANVSLGDLAMVGSHCSVGSDTVLGAFSVLGDGCHVGSGVFIGREVEVGMGSILKDEKALGDGSIVSAGSVVTQNLPEATLAMGNPARPLSTARRPAK